MKVSEAANKPINVINPANISTETHNADLIKMQHKKKSPICIIQVIILTMLTVIACIGIQIIQMMKEEYIKQTTPRQRNPTIPQKDKNRRIGMIGQTEDRMTSFRLYESSHQKS